MNIRKILVNIRNNAQQKAVMVVDRTAKHIVMKDHTLMLYVSKWKHFTN